MVVVLFNAGVQEPDTPFNEVVGNDAIVAPKQTGPTGLKTGTMLELTVIVIVAVFEHCPTEGVNV